MYATQWPYRTAWVMQYIEDMCQQHRMYETETGPLLGVMETRMRLDDILLALIVKDEEAEPPNWEDVLDMDVMVVYKMVVHGLIYAPSEAKALLSLDGDPQNFEGLLLAKPAMCVRDLMTGQHHIASNGLQYERMLRNYAFNLSAGIIAKIAQFIDQLSLANSPCCNCF